LGRNWRAIRDQLELDSKPPAPPKDSVEKMEQRIKAGDVA